MNKNKSALVKNFDPKVSYDLLEALKLVKELAYAKFNETIELIFSLNLDTRKNDQQLRGTFSLPHGTGKIVKIIVICEDEAKTKAAKTAGANLVVGELELKELLQTKAKFAFDVVLTTPQMMPKITKFGKILGPKGLMPNPKMGTIVEDLPKAIQEFKLGKINYHSDKGGNVHTIIGKKDFSDDKIIDNAKVVINLIKKLKPNAVKGTYIKNIVLKTSMSPAVKIKTIF